MEELTQSERAVVELVAQGLSNPEVAERLFVSPHTVRRHPANAMGKLGVNSRVRLANELARRRGLSGEKPKNMAWARGAASFLAFYREAEAEGTAAAKGRPVRRCAQFT